MPVSKKGERSKVSVKVVGSSSKAAKGKRKRSSGSDRSTEKKKTKCVKGCILSNSYDRSVFSAFSEDYRQKKFDTVRDLRDTIWTLSTSKDFEDLIRITEQVSISVIDALADLVDEVEKKLNYSDVGFEIKIGPDGYSETFKIGNPLSLDDTKYSCNGTAQWIISHLTLKEMEQFCSSPCSFVEKNGSRIRIVTKAESVDMMTTKDALKNLLTAIDEKFKSVESAEKLKADLTAIREESNKKWNDLLNTLKEIHQKEKAKK